MEFMMVLVMWLMNGLSMAKPAYTRMMSVRHAKWINRAHFFVSMLSQLRCVHYVWKYGWVMSPVMQSVFLLHLIPLFLLLLYFGTTLLFYVRRTGH